MDKETHPAAGRCVAVEVVDNTEDYSLAVVDKQLDRLADTEARIRAIARLIRDAIESESVDDCAIGEGDGK